MIDSESPGSGYTQGYKDGLNGLPYKYGYNDHHQWYGDEPESVMEEYQEHYSKGYKIGYDKGYNKGKAEYLAKQKATQSAQQNTSTYSDEDQYVSSSTNTSTRKLSFNPTIYNGYVRSDEPIYGDFYTYKETGYCVEGLVVYEGIGYYYIIKTDNGYTVLKAVSGRFDRGDNVRGELNQGAYNTVINRNGNFEASTYIEIYMVSLDRALEWLGDNSYLQAKDQTAYNQMKNR